MFSGIIQGSFNELPGRIARLDKPAVSSNPHDFDSGRLKGVDASYTFPTNLNSDPKPSLVTSFEHKTGRLFNPDVSGLSIGMDFHRSPGQYDSYCLQPEYNISLY
jgi:hypothetical protein